MVVIKQLKQTRILNHSRNNKQIIIPPKKVSESINRRNLLGNIGLGFGLLDLSLSKQADAVQGMTPGRIPGLIPTDKEGVLRYVRPEGKSGGHGVGWSEVPRYQFSVPQGWEEIPVSIADLGGTEIDLRFGNKDEGSLMIVVAPVLRFLDVGFNANVRIEQLGAPEKIITGFAPELFGKPLDEGDVLALDVTDKNGVTYYQYEVTPHHLVSATAVGNRVFILSLNANTRQWRKAENELRMIQQSFLVPA